MCNKISIFIFIRLHLRRFSFRIFHKFLLMIKIIKQHYCQLKIMSHKRNYKLTFYRRNQNQGKANMEKTRHYFEPRTFFTHIGGCTYRIY